MGNKDGTLDKNDLRGAFDNIGVLMSESELDDLMGEVGGPCNFQGMVNMFQEKMAGDGNDPDDLILQAFMAYDQGGKMDVKMFQHALKTWGDKMTQAVVGLFVAVKEEEKKVEEAPAPVEEAPAEEDTLMTPRRRRRRRRRPPSKFVRPNYIPNLKTI